MKSIVTSVIAVLALAACEKASDVNAMQTEINSYIKQNEGLQREVKERAEKLNVREKKFTSAVQGEQQIANELARAHDINLVLLKLLAPDAEGIAARIDLALKGKDPNQKGKEREPAEALRDLTKFLEESHAYVTGPVGPKPKAGPKATDVQIELQRVWDELQVLVEDGDTIANAKLDTAEAWITKQENPEREPPQTVVSAPPEGGSASPQ